MFVLKDLRCSIPPLNVFSLQQIKRQVLNLFSTGDFHRQSGKSDTNSLLMWAHETECQLDIELSVIASDGMGNSCRFS